MKMKNKLIAYHYVTRQGMYGMGNTFLDGKPRDYNYFELRERIYEILKEMGTDIEDSDKIAILNIIDFN